MRVWKGIVEPSPLIPLPPAVEVWWAGAKQPVCHHLGLRVAPFRGVAPFPRAVRSPPAWELVLQRVLGPEWSQASAPTPLASPPIFTWERDAVLCLLSHPSAFVTILHSQHLPIKIVYTEPSTMISPGRRTFQGCEGCGCLHLPESG